MSHLVRLGYRDSVATIVLDSPDNRNAISKQLLDELIECLETARTDPSVRTVVMTATGSTFCSGADLKDPPTDQAGPRSPSAMMASIWAYPKPVVIALNGHVRAGGIGIVASADIVVAPDDATFAFSEVRLGVAPAIIAVPCVRRMPSRALSRYFLTGEPFDASTAANCGLVTEVVPAAEVLRRTGEIVDMLRLGEPHALDVTKALIRDLPGLDVDAGFAHAAPISAAMFASDGAREGMAAFRERRQPVWASVGPASGTGRS